jgi:hypothetical protein
MLKKFSDGLVVERVDKERVIYRVSKDDGILTNDSELLSSANRINRERMSPMAGPPRTRMISQLDPPSSEIGNIYETSSVCFLFVVEEEKRCCKKKSWCPLASTDLNLEQKEFAAVPPENTTNFAVR